MIFSFWKMEGHGSMGESAQALFTLLLRTDSRRKGFGILFCGKTAGVCLAPAAFLLSPIRIAAVPRQVTRTTRTQGPRTTMDDDFCEKAVFARNQAGCESHPPLRPDRFIAPVPQFRVQHFNFCVYAAGHETHRTRRSFARWNGDVDSPFHPFCRRNLCLSAFRFTARGKRCRLRSRVRLR